MARRRDRVYPDTATLYPISIADLVLRLAEIGVIELLWSDYLLDETTRVLIEDKHLPRSAAVYFCDCIRETFPDGRIERSTYEHLIATRTGPDPKDHEHSAAASAANAHVILAADKTGFPIRDTRPAVRRHPDDYLSELLNDYPDIVGPGSAGDRFGANLTTSLSAGCFGRPRRQLVGCPRSLPIGPVDPTGFLGTAPPGCCTRPVLPSTG